jgi:hypothetical protein
MVALSAMLVIGILLVKMKRIEKQSDIYRRQRDSIKSLYQAVVQTEWERRLGESSSDSAP